MNLKSMFVKAMHNTILTIGILAVTMTPLAAVAAYSGCIPQKAVQVVTDVVIDCASPLVLQALTDLVQAAKDALLGDDPKKELDALVAQSKDAGWCAIEVASRDIATPVPASQPTVVNPRVAWTAHGRAEMYLAEHHVKLVHVMSLSDYQALHGKAAQ